jgi:hypothetical protein
VPTSLGNGRRSPKKLLCAVVARLFGQKELKRRLTDIASRSGLSQEQRRQAQEFVDVGEYALAWECIGSWLVENDCPITPRDFAELFRLADRIQLIDRPGIRRLNDDLDSLRRLLQTYGVTINLDGLTVRVEPDGVGSPEGDPEREPVFRYRASISTDDGYTYEDRWWGSATDYMDGHLDCEAIAWMALDRLWTAGPGPQVPTA